MVICCRGRLGKAAGRAVLEDYYEFGFGWVRLRNPLDVQLSMEGEYTRLRWQGDGRARTAGMMTLLP